MLQDALTPPGLWVTLTVIAVASVLIYWKRKPIKRWLRRWRIKELSIGPVKLEVEPEPEPSPQSSPPSPSPKKPSVSPPQPPPVAPISTSLREDPTFQLLCYFARQKQCRLFIGSGVSSEAGMPGDQELRDILRAELIEMGRTVHTDAMLPELATALERAAGRAQLIGVLRRLFDDALRERLWERGAYPWIPRLPRDLVRIIYTTNWDDLLKRAFEAAGQSVREIRDSDDLYLIPRAEHAIVKVNRDLESSEGPIMTEEHWAVVRYDIQARTPGTLWERFEKDLTDYHFVFVGYLPGDPALEFIWQMVKVKQSTDPRFEKRHFLVAPLGQEEAKAADTWTCIHPIVASPSEFFQALVFELKGGTDEPGTD